MMGSGGWGGTRRCRKIDGTNKGQDGLTSTIVPARDIAPPVGGTRVFSLLVSLRPLKPGRSSGCDVGTCPAELGTVRPHAVHDHAIRRATATTARFIPRCRAIFMPRPSATTT